MERRRKQSLVVTALTVGIILIDQIIKMTVKTSMYLYQSIRVTDWFYIHFTENDGMAFGWEFFNKYFLTCFRIVLVVFVIHYIVRYIRRGASWSLLICLSLILAGAIGNIIDCVFYGLIFNSPPIPMVADFVPFGFGYGSVLLGRVVDMFYFPLVEWDWPSWLPLLGGNHFVFFSPIFNFADASISCGFIALLILYHGKLLR